MRLGEERGFQERKTRTFSVLRRRRTRRGRICGLGGAFWLRSSGTTLTFGASSTSRSGEDSRRGFSTCFAAFHQRLALVARHQAVDLLVCALANVLYPLMPLLRGK